MTVQQEYYTSYKNDLTRFVGFGVKATSPGLTPEMQDAINPLIGYKIPQFLAGRPVATHPVALRYLYHKPYESFFLCSQSIGTDADNRPGNFFAHAVVMDTEIFATNPPIFYWKNDFWQYSDPEMRSHIVSLPALPALNTEPSFDIEEMWQFLNQGDRRTWLYKLLCAVINYYKTYRRIIIFDSTENVVQWIACISFLLPSAYRQFLSFSTYSHASLFPHFMINGTTSDWLRDSPQNEQLYFIFNVQDGRCSAVEDSPYAAMITTAARPELLETELLPLLTDYTRRFPTPVAIDQSLDLMMLYANIQRGRNGDTLSSNEIQAIQLALDSFEKLQPIEADDISELVRLQTVLEQVPRHQRSSLITEAQTRVKRLLKKQPAKEVKRQQQEQKHIQADNRAENVSELEPVYNHTLIHSDPQLVAPHGLEVPASSNPELWWAQQNEQVVPVTMAETTGKELDPDEEIRKAAEHNRRNSLLAFIQEFGQESSVVNEHFNQLQNDFQNDNALLTKYVNQPEILQQLVNMCLYAHDSFLIDIWRYLGSYLQIAPQSQPIIISSLNSVIKLKQKKRFVEGDTLFNAMFSTMQGRERQYLQLIVENSHKLVDDIIYYVYRQCIEGLELDQRIPFRTIIQPFYTTVPPLELLERELRLDLYYAELQQGPKVIEDWVEHARQNHYDAIALMTEGILHLERLCDNDPRHWLWCKLASQIFTSNVLNSFPDDIKDELAKSILPALSLATFKPEDTYIVELCRNHHTYQDFSVDTRTTLDAIISMVDGTMNKEVAQRIEQQVKILLPYEYKPGVKRFMSEFFRHDDITTEAHGWVIVAFFTRHYGYDVYFWEAYMAALREALLFPTTKKRVIAMLDFWFARPKEFKDPYVMQEFLLKLPATLGSKQGDQSYNDAVAAFHSSAKESVWHSVVQSCFSRQVEQFSKPWSIIGKKSDEETQALKKAADMFERRSEIQNHRKLLADKNLEELGSAFWKYYWKNFEGVLLRDAGLTFELLAFWFDESFKALPKMSYVPYQFFMGLPQALKDASHKQGFTGIVRKIDNLYLQHEKQYPWYSLVKQYFRD